MKKLLWALPLFLIWATASGGVKKTEYPDYKFNVRWSGAQGNGTTDDRAAIQAAIGKVETFGGGVVWFPEGTYLIDSTIYVPSNVALMGAGRGSQILQDSAFEGYMLRNADTVSGDTNITIEGLFFNGQQVFVNYDSVQAHLPNDALSLDGVTRGAIRNCYFGNTKRDAIGLRDCADIVVTGNLIWNSGEEGIATSGGSLGGHLISNNIIIGQDSTFESASGDKGGGVLCKTSNTTISGNRIQYCGTQIDVNPESGGELYNITIADNELSSVMQNGIAMLGAHHSQITGNVLYDVYGFGIVCGKLGDSVSNHITIANNSISKVRDHTATTSTAHAIEVQWGSNYTITGNVIDSSAIYGIYLRANNSIISNNTVHRTGNHGIYLYDSVMNCIVEGNRVDSAGLSGGVAQGHGIFVYSHSASTDHLSIQGNVVSHCNLSGVALDTVSRSTLAGNVCLSNNIEANNSSGILVRRGRYNTISGNATSGNAYGIRLVDTSRANVIYGNITLEASLGDTFGIVADTGNWLYGNVEDTAGFEPDSNFATLQFVRDSAGSGTGWEWSDSSSFGPDSVLFADSANHADVSDTTLAIEDDPTFGTVTATDSVVTDVISGSGTDSLEIYFEGGNDTANFLFVDPDTDSLRYRLDTTGGFKDVNVLAGTGGGETDTLDGGRAFNGTSAFDLVSDSLGTRKAVRGLEEGSNITITSNDSTLVIAASGGTSDSFYVLYEADVASETSEWHFTGDTIHIDTADGGAGGGDDSAHVLHDNVDTTHTAAWDGDTLMLEDTTTAGDRVIIASPDALVGLFDEIGDTSTYGNIDLYGKLRYRVDTGGGEMMMPFHDSTSGEPAADDVYAWDATDNRWEIKAQTGGAGTIDSVYMKRSDSFNTDGWVTPEDTIFVDTTGGSSTDSSLVAQYAHVTDTANALRAEMADSAQAYYTDSSEVAQYAHVTDTANALRAEMADSAQAYYSDSAAVVQYAHVTDTASALRAEMADSAQAYYTDSSEVAQYAHVTDTASALRTLNLARADLDDSITATGAKIPTAAFSDSTAKLDTTYAGFTTYVTNHAGSTDSALVAQYAHVTDTAGALRTLNLARSDLDDSITATTAKIPTAALSDSTAKLDTTYAGFTTYVTNHAGSTDSALVAQYAHVTDTAGALRTLNLARADLDDSITATTAKIPTAIWADSSYVFGQGGVGNQHLKWSAGHIAASQDNTFDLGTALGSFKDFHIDGNIAISGDLIGDFNGQRLAVNSNVLNASDTVSFADSTLLADSTRKIDTTYAGFTTYVANHGGSGGTSDSIGVDTGAGTFTRFLYPAYLREGTNASFSVTEDTLTLDYMTDTSATGAFRVVIDDSLRFSVSPDSAQFRVDLHLQDSINIEDADTVNANRLEATGALIDSVYLGAKVSDSLAASRYYVRRKADTLQWAAIVIDPSALGANDTAMIVHLDTLAFPEGATILKIGYWAGSTPADTAIIAYSTSADLSSGSVVDSLFLTSTSGEDATLVSTAPTPEDYVFFHFVGSPGYTGTLNLYIVYSVRRKA